MLSNCQNCQYSTRKHRQPGDIGCTLYPEYWAMWNCLQSASQPTATGVIADCREFVMRQDLKSQTISFTTTPQQYRSLLSTELQPQTLTLTATVEQWRSLLSIQFPPELRQQIEEGLGLEEGQIIIMQEVNSNNIAAIGHDGILTLQVNFIEGASYQYFDVSYRVFEAFLAAHSKGDFLYYNIKSRYRYERITA